WCWGRHGWPTAHWRSRLWRSLPTEHFGHADLVRPLAVDKERTQPWRYQRFPGGPHRPACANGRGSSCPGKMPQYIQPPHAALPSSLSCWQLFTTFRSVTIDFPWPPWGGRIPDLLVVWRYLCLRDQPIERLVQRKEDVSMTGLLEGKSALITGGGGGIGRATA